MAAAAMYSIYTKEVEHLAPGTTDHEVSGVGGRDLTYNTQEAEIKNNRTQPAKSSVVCAMYMPDIFNTARVNYFDL